MPGRQRADVHADGIHAHEHRQGLGRGGGVHIVASEGLRPIRRLGRAAAALRVTLVVREEALVLQRWWERTG